MTDHDYLWSPADTPDPEIARLEALLAPLAYAPVPLRADVLALPARGSSASRRLGIAAAAVIALGLGYAGHRASAAPWSVDARAGIPLLRSASGQPSRTATLEHDGMLETDAQSTARLSIGRIGQATIGPGSQLRLVTDNGRQHVLALSRGSMHVSVDAPPRDFVVITPRALVVDLGCTYELSVDVNGNGLLVVEEGEVELQRGTVTISVPAGNSAHLGGSGPGLPVPTQASASFRDAVATYDADPSSSAALEKVLRAADARSTITLWHLLHLSPPAQRALVFERLRSLAPPPAALAHDRLLRGESLALQRWRTELQPSWIMEPPLWRRIWLAVQR